MTRRHGPALLLLPALALIGLAFLVPLALLLCTAITSPELRHALPRSAALLRAWDGQGLPGEETFATLAGELAAAENEQRIGPVARRLNFERPGLRGLLLRTARATPGLRAPFREALPRLDARWAEPALWHSLRAAAAPLTPIYLLRAVDLRLAPGGGIDRVPPEQAVFLGLLGRSLGIAAGVTLLCLLLAYPVAHVLANLPPRWARLGLGFVLLPFWTSALVRSTAWFILLQREGPINAALMALQITPVPLPLVFSRFAVFLALAHVLLPMAVLPLYGVMRRIDPAYGRAAASLGASPLRGFLRVYWPMTLPGVAAGALLVFLLAIGFYITPALVGGNDDQMIGSFIAFYTNEAAEWGMAAALAVLLLLVTGLAFLGLRLLVPGLGAALRAR
jgi:putative spermidine/putrescine transport system permease protein